MSRRLLPLALALLLAAPAAATAYFDVTKLPQPATSGMEIVGNLDAFSNAYTARVTGSPQELQAATFLNEQANKLGYTSEIVDFPAASGGPAAITRGVIATRPGRSKPDEHIVFIAHYDVLPQSITGTYDNGSGTNMLLELAKAFVNVPTNKTITFAWYNGEEEGALASAPHAAQFRAENKKVAAVLGFDMVGLAWPVATPVEGRTCLCTWYGSEDEAFEPLLRHVNFGLLGFPDEEGKVQVVGLNDRNSDEASWDRADYPTMRWAGMRTASSYPAYHQPDDTLETMDTVAGGRSFVEQGMRNTLLSAYLTALTVDNEMPTATASATGTSPVTFSSAGSGDADAAPSQFKWDFGDGTSATGLNPSHTYAKGGTYTARLDVVDNLWPQVSVSATVQVTVPGAAGARTVKKASCNAKAKKIKSKSKRAKALKKCKVAKKKAACTRKAKKITDKRKRAKALKKCRRIKR